MQHLNVPVAAGRGRDDRRRAAALEAAAGDAERATAEQSCPSWGSRTVLSIRNAWAAQGRQPLGGGQRLQMRRLPVRGPGAADGLAVQRDHQRPGIGYSGHDLRLQPGPERGGQRLAIQLPQEPPERGQRRRHQSAPPVRPRPAPQAPPAGHRTPTRQWRSPSPPRPSPSPPRTPAPLPPGAASRALHRGSGRQPSQSGKLR